MLQVLHTDVAKVDRDIAHVTRVCSKCFICLKSYVAASVLNVASYKCFMWILYMLQ
jgi:hypothetical protein